jgi:hypothetical protein
MDVEPLTTNRTNLVIVNTPIVVWIPRYGRSSQTLTEGDICHFESQSTKSNALMDAGDAPGAPIVCLELQFPTPAHARRKSPHFSDQRRREQS